MRVEEEQARTVFALPTGHGMDPRVAATELRSCFALG